MSVALRIIPTPAHPAPQRGQRCFGFLPVVFVVHMPTKRGGHKPCKPKFLSPQQLLPLTRSLQPRRAAALHEFVPRRMLPGARPRSMGTHRISRAERSEMKTDVKALTRSGVYRRRPKTLADCKPGPCPWVSCRHHLKLDVDPVTHAVKDNFPGIDVDEMAETCSLRVAATLADGETMPLEQVGAFANVTMERARQLEKEGLASMKRGMKQAKRRDVR